MHSNHKDNLPTLDEVVKNTLESLEQGKSQIYDIAETSKKEYERVQRELEGLRGQTKTIIAQVDELERQSRSARIRLAEVDNNFKLYSEEDIKAAYVKASDYQVGLTQMREREKQLRQKRDELERSLRNLQETVEKAERLVSQVGVVLDFIGGNLQNVQTELEKLQNRQEMGILIIKGQEEERKRIAREIHDGPAQAIANVVLRVEFCEKLLDFEPDRVRIELLSLKDMVRVTLQDLRKIIFDLRPMALDDLGLVPALNRYITDYREKYQLEGKFTFLGTERRLKSALEVGLFRIIQEALNNIWKHAKASQITVKLEMAEETVTVIVQDDGQGFNMDQAIKANQGRESLGLTSMKERVELLGGTFELWTAEGKGTKITVKVPAVDEQGVS